jgi:hypothetical protein
MKIKVKDGHIMYGEPDNCQHCAIALAVKDSLNAETVSVNVDNYNNDNVSISAWFNGVKHKIKICHDDQHEVNDFVNDFDRYYEWDGDKSKLSRESKMYNQKVYPFEFDVEINEEKVK